MKNKIAVAAATSLVIASLALALPAFAENASSTAKKIANSQNKGEQMIAERITSLNNTLTRIQGLKNVSDTEKASLTATVQAVIASLTTLKSQIAADTSTTSLRTDLSAITQANRVYALVIPQTNIIAAGDRVETIVAMMNTVMAKLQTRISAASTTPSGVSTTMNDLTAKMNDANTQAQAAISEVSALMPDQGDKTKLASNTATLKDARSKIKAATKDIAAARKDISSVTKALGKTK